MGMSAIKKLSARMKNVTIGLGLPFQSGHRRPKQALSREKPKCQHLHTFFIYLEQLGWYESFQTDIKTIILRLSGEGLKIDALFP